MTTIDKSSWPTLQPLPAQLPAPAAERSAKYPPSGRVLAGKAADSAHEPLFSVGQADALTPDHLSAHYVGREALPALSAAAHAAAQLQPAPSADKSPAAPAQTLVGVYQVPGGGFYTEPLWQVPSRGTQWMENFTPVPETFATTPDMRFDFHDDRLAAVVTSDGFIVNPKNAAFSTAG
jgi:hypothetical protein